MRTTSIAAEAKADKITNRQRVLDAIRTAPAGLTDEQIADATGLPENSVRPRRLDLLRDGLLYPVEGVTRKTKHGNPAMIWRAV